ncbi:hypothetical protein KJ780_04270 [Candidatus Micrarchaeota archaeon]|nr:hypothetical protein [Candidatus Micrarchaeota archaeon]
MGSHKLISTRLGLDQLTRSKPLLKALRDSLLAPEGPLPSTSFKQAITLAAYFLAKFGIDKIDLTIKLLREGSLIRALLRLEEHVDETLTGPKALEAYSALAKTFELNEDYGNAARLYTTIAKTLLSEIKNPQKDPKKARTCSDFFKKAAECLEKIDSSIHDSRSPIFRAGCSYENAARVIEKIHPKIAASLYEKSAACFITSNSNGFAAAAYINAAKLLQRFNGRKSFELLLRAEQCYQNAHPTDS